MRTKTFWVVVLLMAGAVALRADDWHKTYEVNGKPEVRVETDDGSIHVSGGGKGQIRADVSTCGWKIGQDQVRVEEHQNGNRVELNVRVPRGPHVMIFRCRSVRVDLTVPTETDLDLHSKDGSITVADVKGNQRLNSGDGRIEARGMDGSLRADTRDGSVTVDGRFDVLNVHTGDGRIEASARPGSKLATGWAFRTSDGSVNVQLAPDIAADLDAHTGDGRIDSDFPVTISGSSSGDSKSVRGRLNGGGPILEIRTGDGSIHISKY